MDRGRGAGDVVSVGRTVELEVLDTPGHTMSHVCLLSRSDQPCLFSGDTLFNAGAGNCHNGGHPQQLYRTFAEQLAKLPETTRIYPGHDYIANRTEEHTSELQSLMRISYAVFCLKKKKNTNKNTKH